MTEREVFVAALQIGDPAGRNAYLDRACADDTALRRRVNGLLGALGRVGEFLEVPVAVVADPDRTHGFDPEAAGEGPGEAIGPYRLVESIGEGGMGVVWLAEQQEPVRRPVALKVIKAGMDSRQVLARFEVERQALALMDHPNIARVLDAGATDSGRPYFVMELVQGTPITNYCDEHRLEPWQRLRLFVQVCHAVQHAHQKGIIHRDLKPNNVLVATYDGEPVVKVIDFGVAKATGQPLTEQTLVTGIGVVVGTPEYMSPEQAELNNADIDTRSDIYSLGVLLYELLTGTTPLTRRRVHEVALLEVLRLVREDEPARPSARLSATWELPRIAADRGLEPVRLSRLVRGELDLNVMQALEKDRNRRYPTANDLAEDVRRYLTGASVLACPPSAGYRARKFARKNRTMLATAGAFAALLVAASIGSTVLATWAMRERDRADEQKRSAEADFKRALGAVDQMLTRVGEVQLAHVPQMEPVRRDLLQDALGFYQEFLRERGDSPVVRAEAAKAYRRVGQIQDLLGQRDEAEKAYVQAAALLESLAAESPDDSFVLSEQAAVHRGLGLVYHATRRWPEAEKSLEQGVALLERANLEHQTNRRDLAGAHVNLVNLFRQMGKLDRAETAHVRSMELLDRLQAGDPTDSENLILRARSYQNVGLVYMAKGRMADAEEVYQKALVLNQQLHRVQPDVVDHRRRLSGTLNNLGLLYARDRQNEKAEAAFRESLAHKEATLRDYPMVTVFKIELAGAYDNLAMQVRMRSPEEALELAGRAIPILESVLAKDDRDITARMGLFNSLMGRAYALGRLERHEDAAKVWRRVLEISDGQPHINMRLYRPFAHLRLGEHAAATAESETVLAEGHAQPPNLHRFASIHSLASAAAAKDARLAPDVRAKLADQYGGRAVELLQMARAAGHYRKPSQLTDLKEHKDFDAIRSRSDFQMLLGELEKESPPS